MKFELEWQAAPGVRDAALAATWARLGLKAGDICITEAVDLCSDSRRTGIYGPLFPLVEWLVEHWWHLLHEPAPCAPAPGGRLAPQWMTPWIQRHNLLAAREGGALPDLTIMRDGDDLLLQWEPDPATSDAVRLRFVGKGHFRMSERAFGNAAGAFIETVLARLAEKLSGNEDVERVASAWNAVRTADYEESALCRSLAAMGVDPYDPAEATDSLMGVVAQAIRKLPEGVLPDFFEGSDPKSLSGNLQWVETVRPDLLCTPGGVVRFPTVEPTTAPTAHETGYLAARRVRKDLLGMKNDAPIADLPQMMESRLGWTRGCMKAAPGETIFEGMVGIDKIGSAPVLIVPDQRNENAERFRLARAAFYPVSKNLGAFARLLTRSATHHQRAARAFAAELLAPAAALANRVSSRVSEQEVEMLAADYRVSQQDIVHQIENHRIGYIDT